MEFYEKYLFIQPNNLQHVENIKSNVLNCQTFTVRKKLIKEIEVVDYVDGYGINYFWKKKIFFRTMTYVRYFFNLQFF